MIRRRCSSAVKQQWKSVMASVADDGDSIVVESHGKPKLALISFEDFQEFQDFKEQMRRAETLHRFRLLGERIGDKNRDLSDAQIEELADRHSREFILELARSGKMTFERDLAQYEREPQG